MALCLEHLLTDCHRAQEIWRNLYGLGRIFTCNYKSVTYAFQEKSSLQTHESLNIWSKIWKKTGTWQLLTRLKRAVHKSWAFKVTWFTWRSWVCASTDNAHLKCLQEIHMQIVGWKLYGLTWECGSLTSESLTFYTWTFCLDQIRASQSAD